MSGDEVLSAISLLSERVDRFEAVLSARLARFGGSLSARLDRVDSTAARVEEIVAATCRAVGVPARGRV